MKIYRLIEYIVGDPSSQRMTQCQIYQTKSYEKAIQKLTALQSDNSLSSGIRYEIEEADLIIEEE